MGNKRKFIEGSGRYYGRRLSSKKSAVKRRKKMKEESEAMSKQCVDNVLEKDKHEKLLTNHDLVSTFEINSSNKFERDEINIENVRKCDEKVLNDASESPELLEIQKDGENSIVINRHDGNYVEQLPTSNIHDIEKGENDYKNIQIELRQLRARINKLSKRMRNKNFILNDKCKKNKKQKRLWIAKKYKIMKNKLTQKIQGRRIIDFGYMWKEMRSELHDHITKKGRLCSYRNWDLLKENNHHGGLRTLFCFKCKKCGEERCIWSEDNNDTKMNVNMASVLGILAEGLGYEQVKGLLAGMDIPYISDKTFKNYQEGLFISLKEIINRSCEEANAEEARLAKESGEVHESGVPLITVVVDGSWLKRSYGSAYDSYSGCGAIIGERTGKVLYIGVMNKFCLKCDTAEKYGRKAEQHNCVRNFPMNKPSTLMETYALIEGFELSYKRYGVVYNYVIGDGDSNFFTRLLQVNPYKELNIIPQKIECTNHLMRNLCKNIRDISCKGFTRNKGYIKFRNVVQGSSLKIRQAILDEIDTTLLENRLTWNEKIIILRDKIRYIPRHIFGDHRKCQKLGIQCHVDEISITPNLIPSLITFGLLKEIDHVMWRTSVNSESLLHKKTNNVAESLNNIIGKLVSGKRINYVMSNQYTTRVYIAVLQHNSLQASIDILKHLGYVVPEPLRKVISKRKDKVIRYRASVAQNRRRKKKLFTGTDKNYGPFCQKPDLSEEALKDERERHFAKLEGYRIDRCRIEEETREQSKSPTWMNTRKDLVTASNYGRICRKKKSTSCSKIVIDLLYKSSFWSLATNYGLESEQLARQEVSAQIKKEIKICGLFIDEDEPMFGATPDGLIDDDGIFEVKSSYVGREYTVDEATDKFYELQLFDKKTKQIKKSHKWYYQIQGQLHVTRRKYCIFALRTDKDLKTYRIERDDEFWEKNMRPHLVAFYEDCLLPEILDPRYLRSMEIRDPPYITEAQNVLKEKREQKLKEESFEGSDSKLASKHENQARKIRTKKRPIIKKDNISMKYPRSNHGKNSTENVYAQSRRVANKRTNIHRRLTMAPKKKRKISKTSKTVKMIGETNCYGKLDDEVQFVSEEIHEWTLEDMRNQREYFEGKIHDGITDEIYKLLKNPSTLLNDDAIDIFIKVIQDNSDYEIQSVMYEFYPHLVEPVETKALAFLKLMEPEHWRLAHYNESCIVIYDSIFGQRGQLCDAEIEYTSKRFPNIASQNIKFAKLKFQQADGNNCGIYSAAFATEIILNGDPENIKFSINSVEVRNHYLEILTTGKLSLFPALNRQLIQ